MSNEGAILVLIKLKSRILEQAGISNKLFEYRGKVYIGGLNR